MTTLAPPTTGFAGGARDRRIRVVQQALGERGRLTYVYRTPHRGLRSVMQRDHIVFRQEHAPFDTWLEPPQPAPTLMISLEGRIAEGDRPLPRAWFAGMTDRPALPRMSPGRHDVVDLKLTPLGAHRLLGMPLSELTNEIVELDDLLGAPARELVERLHAAPSEAARFELVDAFMLRRVAEAPAPLPAIDHAVRRLRETDGRLAIGTLARELSCSRRYLAVRFREQVGLPPKTFARLLRFDHVRRRIDAAPARWADVAAECGYTDQSHLARDFRELAGTTPTEFAGRLLPGIGLVGDGLGEPRDTAVRLSA